MPRHIAALAVSALLVSCAPTSLEEPAEVDLDAAFDAASKEHEVPRDLLVAIAYTVSRLDERGGEPSIVGGYGVMNLRDGVPGEGASLERAADRLGVEPLVLMRDQDENIRGAAAELRAWGDAFEDETGSELVTLGDWVEVVAEYSGAQDGAARYGFAKEVYRWIEGGLDARSPEGQRVRIESRELDIPAFDLVWKSGGGDYAGSAAFVAAHSGNYSDSSRGPSSIDTIVVHTAQGSYYGTSSWFANSAASASAHYVVRSSDGEVTQMVWEQDVAWHAGYWDTNARSVGIELEGYVDKPSTYYTEAMYGSLAALIVDISDRQGVSLDRSHIIGHSEVPGCSTGSGGGASCHTDPGSGFDWDKLMDEVAARSGGSSSGGSGSGSGTGGSGSGGSSYGVGDLVGFVRADSVYNVSGAISGATVTLSSGETTTTNGDGWYQFSGVGAGWVDLTVSASGYSTLVDAKELSAGSVNWNSVALAGGSSSSGSYSPTGDQTVYGPSVTMDWEDGGASQHQVKIHVRSGGGWDYYVDYTTTDSEKTFWPVVDDEFYAWSVRSYSGGWGPWSDTQTFYFAN